MNTPSRSRQRAPQSNRRQQKDKSVFNASKVKTQYAEDQDDRTTASPTASTTQSLSDDEDRRSYDSSPAATGWGLTALPAALRAHSKQDLPPPPPIHTKLKSKAALFVPMGAVDAQCPFFVPGACPPCGTIVPAGGKECLASVIQNTLGGELWNLSMVDCPSYTGEWYTAVEITIPALSASMCHLAASNDVEAIAAAQQATQSTALKSVTRALQSLSPKITVVPSDHTAQLSVEYCGADRDMLCREFAYCGHCPRMATCRWAHAMVETFMINFFLQPLAQSQGEMLGADFNQQAMPQPTNESPQINCSNLVVLPLTSMPVKEISGITDPGADKPLQLKPLTPDKRPKNPRLKSKASWADMQEDDDDDFALPNWSLS